MLLIWRYAMNRLSPLEIQRLSFPRRLQGFDPEAVREILHQLADQCETDAREKGELKAEVVRLTRELDEHRQRTAAVQQALVEAQQAAEQTIARAGKEAEHIVAEAQSLADRILEDATRRVENIELVAAQLRSRRRTARADLRRLLEIIEGAIRDDESAESSEPETPTLAVLRPRQRESRGER